MSFSHIIRKQKTKQKTRDTELNLRHSVAISMYTC